MKDPESPILKAGMPHSRRKAIKLAFLAGSGLAIASNPALTDDSAAMPQPIPMLIPGSNSQGQVKPNSATTPGTNYLIFSGVDFKPINSTTSYSHVNVSGVYASASYYYFVVSINLPQAATITELEFYVTHNLSGTVLFYLSLATPSTGNEVAISTGSLTATDPGVVTVPVTILAGHKVDNTSNKYLLFWFPAGNGTSEILWGARLGYTGGLGRFGA